MCDYAVSCSYGDIVLIICMLHDYVKMLDEVMGDNVEYQAYYRKKFLDMAERLSGQIEYDYDKAVEKCRKKRLKETRGNDIGEDGLSQLIKRGLEKAENKKIKVNCKVSHECVRVISKEEYGENMDENEEENIGCKENMN